MSVTEQLSMNEAVLRKEGWTANELALIELFAQRKSFGGTNERALAMLLIRDGGVEYDIHWGAKGVNQNKENDK